MSDDIIDALNAFSAYLLSPAPPGIIRSTHPSDTYWYADLVMQVCDELAAARKVVEAARRMDTYIMIGDPISEADRDNPDTDFTHDFSMLIRAFRSELAVYDGPLPVCAICYHEAGPMEGEPGRYWCDSCEDEVYDRTQTPTTGINAIVGQWPGDETDEEVEEAMKALDDEG